MLIWFTGLPCIGKTTALRRAVLLSDINLILADRLRNRILRKELLYTKKKCSVPVEGIYKFHFVFKPLKEYIELETLYAENIKRFYSDDFERLSKSKQKYLIEISPFMLIFLKPSEPIILAQISNLNYYERVYRRYKFSYKSAKALVEFYNYAIEQLANNLTIVDCIYLDQCNAEKINYLIAKYL